MPMAIWGGVSFDRQRLNLRGAHPPKARNPELYASLDFICVWADTQRNVGRIRKDLSICPQNLPAKRCTCNGTNLKYVPMRCKCARTALHVDVSSLARLFPGGPGWPVIFRVNSFSSLICRMMRVECFPLSLCGKYPWRPPSRYYYYYYVVSTSIT
ncbi:hypothetical protein LI328DRAFT_50274 [Trichoderma asperelloides]|nr:hypothetical protein LI328DRAFT_50274 [Trichoderma asperelloides]